MKYVLIFRNRHEAATFSALDDKRAAQMARGLIKFMVKDVKPADGSEVTKADFRLRLAVTGPVTPLEVAAAAAATPAPKPAYKSKYAPVRVKK